MTRSSIPLLALALLAPLAQAQHIDDPANLLGERISPQSPADRLPLNHGAPALQQLLLKLRTRASLLMIVAHPDDEDGGLLTYESRGQGARVGMLTLTRGEGGQNLMTADFNDALGLIRTEELLAADRYLGVDQMFGTEVDFGFSKTKEESFDQWTHQRVLYDAVRAVRLYRPLVLASVFLGGVTDGHGHHQVAGEITQEVFLAAADPKLFPEMGLPPWAPLAVYARVPFSRVTKDGMYDYATGKTLPPYFHNYITGVDTTTPPEATITIHEGAPATIAGQPSLGMENKSYVQFARSGLALQKTQIGEGVRLAPAGEFNVGYTLMCHGCPMITQAAGRRLSWGQSLPAPTSTPDLFTSLDITLPAIAGEAPSAPPSLRQTLTRIDTQLADAQQLFTPTHPELTAPPLREALRTLDTLLQQTENSTYPQTEKFNLLHELRIKRVQLNNALLLAHGITLTATLAELPLQPTAPYTLTANLKLTQPGPPITLLSAGLRGIPAGNCTVATFPEPEASVSTTTSTCTFSTPPPPTQPFFSRPNLEQPFYTLRTPALRNAPATPTPIVTFASLSDQGVPLTLEAFAVLPDTTNPPQPAVFIPRLSISLMPALAVLPTVPSAAAVAHPFSVTVRTNVADLAPRIEVALPASWKLGNNPADFTLRRPGDTHTVSQSFLPAPQDPKPETLEAFAIDPASTNRQGTNLGYRVVGYQGLTPTNLYTPASLKAIPLEVTTAPNLKIAYITGTGDQVPDYLPNLGITPTLLTPDDLTKTDLTRFDAILLGVRAYNAHPDLAGAPSAALLAYANQGGVVIAQYNTGNLPAAATPYPLEIPGDPAHNVVVEATPVQILIPESPVFNFPNHITAADFEHWTEERGHGFPDSWNFHYQALLETHDPGQDPQRGGLLVARTGRGFYVYVALALYRQLPEGVPGAYRLLANLLSLKHAP